MGTIFRCLIVLTKNQVHHSTTSCCLRSRPLSTDQCSLIGSLPCKPRGHGVDRQDDRPILAGQAAMMVRNGDPRVFKRFIHARAFCYSVTTTNTHAIALQHPLCPATVSCTSLSYANRDLGGAWLKLGVRVGGGVSTPGPRQRAIKSVGFYDPINVALMLEKISPWASICYDLRDVTGRPAGHPCITVQPAYI